MNYVLETKHLTKKYGSQYAVKDINIHLVKGQIYGLVGRNGAGKTTLLRMLSGLSRPTDGTFEVFGKDGRKARVFERTVSVFHNGRDGRGYCLRLRIRRQKNSVVR